ncbi:MAG: type II secretion system GspH family protein [Acidobacteriota bacterium]|nr:type II secretion system GspH family protein [Acidobacteriota bacterium]
MKRTSARRYRRLRQGGYTLTEMVIVCILLVSLTAAALPIGRVAAKRSKEADLSLALRLMRNAIDEYKRFSDAGLIPIELGSDGYPPDLETLVEGIDVVGQIDARVRFLRRIPVDPMTGEAEWGLRAYDDDWDDDSWGGGSVYDVYSQSEGVGLNDVEYRLW